MKIVLSPRDKTHRHFWVHNSDASHKIAVCCRIHEILVDGQYRHVPASICPICTVPSNVFGEEVTPDDQD